MNSSLPESTQAYIKSRLRDNGQFDIHDKAGRLVQAKKLIKEDKVISEKSKKPYTTE
ncbi:MAG: hypothetical protein GOV15_03450 [Candidatus Diapherotrites archaeon]|nr:hypothetical protein [Candidatus Diapherotrites archaeon]